MRYFSINTISPLSFSSCGQLLSRDGFLHHRRCFEQNVLIFVTEGVLHITAAEQSYNIGPQQYIFLKAGEEHFGHKASLGRLSYLWVHFQADSPIVSYPEATLSDITPLFCGPGSQDNVSPSRYLFAQQGKTEASKRFPLLFHQLLDLSMEEALYTSAMPDYALSLLMMELTRESLTMQFSSHTAKSPVIIQICEWIKANYYHPFTVSGLAAEFGYQPDYLSNLFKKQTGTTLTQYTNKIRIETSKNLLTNYGLSIKEAAYSCGFPDEKYYMKIFKKTEGITPTQYKTAFFKKSIN